MGFPLGNFFYIQAFILIVGAVAGPVAVVVFTSLRTLTKITTQLVSSVNSSARPKISRAYGEGNFELLRELYRRSTQVSIWIAALLVIFLAVFGAYIADFWTAGRVQVSYPFFWLLLATVFVNSIWWGSLNILYGTNNHQKLAIVYIIVNAGFAGLAYPLLLSYAISGAAYSLLAIELVLALYTIGCAISLIEEKPSRLIADY